MLLRNHQYRRNSKIELVWKLKQTRLWLRVKDLDKFNAITKALLGSCQIGTFNPLIHKVLKWSDTL